MFPLQVFFPPAPVLRPYSGSLSRPSRSQDDLTDQESNVQAISHQLELPLPDPVLRFPSIDLTPGTAQLEWMLKQPEGPTLHAGLGLFDFLTIRRIGDELRACATFKCAGSKSGFQHAMLTSPSVSQLILESQSPQSPASLKSFSIVAPCLVSEQLNRNRKKFAWRKDDDLRLLFVRTVQAGLDVPLNELGTAWTCISVKDMDRDVEIANIVFRKGVLTVDDSRYGRTDMKIDDREQLITSIAEQFSANYAYRLHNVQASARMQWELHSDPWRGTF